jgi:hypothetical protein
MIRDFHLVVISIVHMYSDFPRIEKSRWQDTSLGKWPGRLRNVAARRALLRALRTKSIFFSVIARPLAGSFVSLADGETSRSACVPIASRHQRPVTRNRRKREQSRPCAAHNRRERRKCSRTRTRACFVGKETVPHRQLYLRRKIVPAHAVARDATRAHTGAQNAARCEGEMPTMGLITKSGTISWEFRR